MDSNTEDLPQISDTRVRKPRVSQLDAIGNAGDHYGDIRAVQSQNSKTGDDPADVEEHVPLNLPVLLHFDCKVELDLDCIRY